MSQAYTLDSGNSLPSGGLRAWMVCVSAGLFFFYEFFQLNIFDVINLPLRQDFNLDATQISWMSSTYLWADILFLVPAGIILDRFSPRKVIITALAVCVLGTLGFAKTGSFVLACFFHFLSGIGNAFCFLSCIVLVSRWFPPRKQALVIGSVVTLAFLGGMMAHTPFAQLTEILGWRQSLVVDGCVGIVLLVWIALIVRDQPDELFIEKNTAHHSLIPDFLHALKNPQNWLAGLYTSLLNLPIMVLCALWGASYLQTVHHLSELSSSNLISLIFVGSIIGCPIMGWLSDKLGQRKPMMVWGALATFLTVLPFMLNFHLNTHLLTLLFFALGFFSSTQVISYPLIAESNPLKVTGAATSIASVLIMGGGGLGQVLFGWLMQFHAGTATSQYSIADYHYAMWMFPLSAIIGLVAVLLIKETHCERRR